MDTQLQLCGSKEVPLWDENSFLTFTIEVRTLRFEDTKKKQQIVTNILFYSR